MWIGGPGDCSGFGRLTASVKSTCRPWNDESSVAQISRSAARCSSAMRPRSANGTPRAAYSSASQPTPTPSSKRPPLKWSRVLTSRAHSSGWRNGSRATAVPTRSVVVCSASAWHVRSGSNSAGRWPTGSCGDDVEPGSGGYGYTDV